MDCEQGIIFCQDDFMAKSFSTFEEMRRNEEFVDFKVSFENRTIVGHRLVLAARIPQLRKILCGFEDEITVKEVDPDILESLFNFAYSGKIEITPGNVVSLLSTSKFLQITEVYDACWEFLEGRLSLDNVLEIRRLAEEHCYPKFLEVADNYVIENFEEFVNSENFLALPVQQLMEVISRDDIKVSTEEEVFEAVISWVKASPSERRDLLPELLSSVRMYFLTPGYLTERVSPEELVRSSLRCRDLVEEAIYYHLLPDKRPEVCLLSLQPRLHYTNSIFPAQSRHDKMHNFSADGERSFIYYLRRSCDETFKVKLLHPERKIWLNLSSYDAFECINKVVALDGVIYVFATLLLYTFDLKTCEWTSLGDTQDVCGSGSVSYNSKIYFFGGLKEESYKIRAFDPLQLKMHLEGRMPRPLQQSAIAVSSSSREGSSETCMYITGGFFEHNVFSNVERFNPETKEWTKVKSMFWRRYDHGCCDLNGKIYVCGGTIKARKPLNSAEVYDPLTDQWDCIASVREKIFMLSVTSNEGKLYMCGKQRRYSAMNIAKMEIYDPKEDEWEDGALICDTDVRIIDKIFLVKSDVFGDIHAKLLC